MPDSSDPPQHLDAMRRSYPPEPLRRAQLSRTWHEQLAAWLDDAAASEAIGEPNAMVLATADGDGRLHSRTVLLKDLRDERLTFYTNYNSAKARDLAANPNCAVTFPWFEIGRQVTVVGQAKRGSDAAADTYFASRPHGSKIGALASDQSSRIDSRESLERRAAELSAQYPVGSEIPRPRHWGGFEISPTSVEFWQGRPDRLHDRLRYTRTADGAWIVERLAP